MTERLPDELRELIAKERATPPLADDAAARIAARLSGTLALPLPPPDLGAASGSVAAAPGPAAVAATSWTAAKLAPIAIAFVIGGASGAAITASVLEPRPVPVPAEERRVAPAPLPPPSSPPAAATAQAPAPTLMQPDDGVTAPGLEPPVVSTRVGKASSAPSAPERDATDRELRAERELLELARRAIAQGHAADALEALESHDRRFPRGRLSEERDSLRVPALVMLGDPAEAARRAEQFRARHPSSLFLPVVERALQAAGSAPNP